MFHLKSKIAWGISYRYNDYEMPHFKWRLLSEASVSFASNYAHKCNVMLTIILKAKVK